MNIPNADDAPPARRFWLLALVPLSALAGIALLAHHSPHPNRLQQSLDSFQDDGAAPIGVSPHMADLIILRNDLLGSTRQQQPRKLSPAQDRLVIDCLQGPVDESSQSEALDVLKLAARAGFLTPSQTHEANEECFSILRRTPPPMVRLEAARFLGYSKDPRRIAALDILRNDPDPKIQGAAKKGLTKIKP
jgi:hypothetical protein